MSVHPGQIPLRVAPAVPMDPIYRLTVAQYHEMVQQGILTTEDQVELLEGWLVTKMPKNPPHVLSSELTAEKLSQLMPEGWHVRKQDPITTDDSEPEPDVAVVRGGRRDYVERHPTAADLALVVEVADSTLERDRTLKLRAYARAGVPIYWIVNLIDRRVEVFTNPTGPADRPHFRDRLERTEQQSVAMTIGGAEVGSIPVRELLP